MDLLSRYLAAVDVPAGLAPTLDTLHRLLAGHLRTFAYETLGMALGQEYPLDPEACVERALEGRAGYCYTQNTAFAWVLEQHGFDVRRHLGVVTGRSKPEPTEVTGGHLALTVVADGTERLADAGLGPLAAAVVPLRPHDVELDGFTHRLDRSPVPGAAWRLTLDPNLGGFRWMDFAAQVSDHETFVPLHEERRHIGEPGRPYFVVQRPVPGGVEMLAGIRFTTPWAQPEILADLETWRATVARLGCRALEHASDDHIAALHARLDADDRGFHADR